MRRVHSVRVDRDDSGHTAPFPPSGFVDGLVSEGIDQKAIATIGENANRVGRAVRARALAGAYTLVRSRRVVIPKGKTGEVV